MVALVVLVVGLAPLAERHRAFLEDEAHFLLTAPERARFTELETGELRDRFVEPFWRRHDRGRHLERLRACDRLFGVRGRWSERGRIYQLLGAPSFRESLARAGNLLVPSELWHYTGLDVSFLPDAFYLVFFRRGGAGEYRLWHPSLDGAAALVGSAEGSGLERGAAPRLDRIDPELAVAVEGLVPGGGLGDARSLLASLDGFAAMAERERVYGEDVRVAVATRELPARLAAAVLLDDVGVAEIHYALELAPGAIRALRWRSEGDRYRARFTLVGRLVGAGDSLDGERERWEDSIELDVTASEKRALASTRLSFRGRRVVHPADERLEIALVTAGAGTIAAASIDAASPAPTADENPIHAGVVDADGGARREAVRVLERERTPSELARYRFARALARARRGERSRAIEELEAAVALDGDNARVHLELARLLYASGRYRDVLERLGDAAARFPDEVDVWVLSGGAAEALGEFSKAVRYYDRAAQLAPDDAAIAEARARARRR